MGENNAKFCDLWHKILLLGPEEKPREERILKFYECSQTDSATSLRSSTGKLSSQSKQLVHHELDSKKVRVHYDEGVNPL